MACILAGYIIYCIRPNKRTVRLQKHEKGVHLKISILNFWKGIHLHIN